MRLDLLRANIESEFGAVKTDSKVLKKIGLAQDKTRGIIFCPRKIQFHRFPFSDSNWNRNQSGSAARKTATERYIGFCGIPIQA